MPVRWRRAILRVVDLKHIPHPVRDVPLGLPVDMMLAQTSCRCVVWDFWWSGCV